MDFTRDIFVLVPLRDPTQKGFGDRAVYLRQRALFLLCSVSLQNACLRLTPEQYMINVFHIFWQFWCQMQKHALF